MTVSRTTLLAPLVAATCLCAQAVEAQSSSNFLRLRLPKGVSVELPRNWVVFNGSERITLDAAVESMGLAGANSDLGFAANLVARDGRTLALMNIRYYPEIEVTQDDVRSAGPEEVEEVDKVLRKTLQTSVEAGGLRILQWNGTRKRAVNGITVLESKYVRSPHPGHQGNMVVTLARVLAGGSSFTLTTSFNQQEEYLLKPLTERIVNSLSLDSSSKSTEPAAPPRTKPSPAGHRSGSQSVFDKLIVGFLAAAGGWLLIKLPGKLRAFWLANRGVSGSRQSRPDGNAAAPAKSQRLEPPPLPEPAQPQAPGESTRAPS